MSTIPRDVWQADAFIFISIELDVMGGLYSVVRLDEDNSLLKSMLVNKEFENWHQLALYLEFEAAGSYHN